MSRIAKNPVVIPEKVEVSLGQSELTVKGPLGTLRQALSSDVVVKIDAGQVTFVAANGSIQANAMSGTMRALVANMVQGVKQGFEKKLTLVGVGYKAQAQGNKVNLALGFSHPIVHLLPEGVKAETPTQTEILIKGVDRQKVGQVAAEIRAYKSPEPYKGKGVRYANETVVIKETKKK
jgi:large subunit ribosomal protein L6